MVAVGIAVAIGVPGVAFASTSEVTPEPAPSVQQDGPPSWAPEECQELWGSKEMQERREEHRAEMQEHRTEMREHRTEHRIEMQEHHGQVGGEHPHGAGHGPGGGHMWDGASS